MEFHNKWWGRSWDKNVAGQPPNSDPLIYIHEAICEGLEILQETGFLFQRAGYGAFNNRIRNAKAERSHHNLFSCLLLGQPGIGSFAYFL